MSPLCDRVDCPGGCGNKMHVDKVVCCTCWYDLPVALRTEFRAALLSHSETSGGFPRTINDMIVDAVIYERLRSNKARAQLSQISRRRAND